MSVIGDYLLSLPDETLDVLFRNGRRASEAEHINRNANEHLSRAYEDYKRTRDKTIDSLDELNKRKMKVMGREIVLFVDIFSKVQNVDLSECKGLSEIKTVEFTEIDYTDMNNEIEDMYNFIKDGMKTYFFGGIVLGSIIMGRKSKISYNNAKANEAASKIEIERLESEEMELDAISKLAKQEDKTIRKLAKLAKKPLELFNEIVSMKTDWNKFTNDEKQTVASLMSLIKLIKLIIDQPVINSDGEIDNSAFKQIENKDIVRLINKEK